MFNSMKKLISKKFYKTAEIAQNKVDVFYACNRLTDEEYAERSICQGYFEKDHYQLQGQTEAVRDSSCFWSVRVSEIRGSGVSL